MDHVRDLNDMLLFAEVVDHGGYTAAARALGMQTSKLSRRIAELERQLGVRLLNRTTRRISVTESGQTFHRHCVAMVGEARAAKEAIDQTRSGPQGLVRLSCPVPLLQSDVAVVIARYLADHPLVRISVEATGRRVDLVEEGFDIALRVRPPPLEDSDLAVRTLGVSQMALVGSPWLFARLRRPTTVEQLDGLPTLAMARAGDRHAWQFRGAGGEAQTFAHVPRLVTDDMDTLRRAALEGVGLTLLPSDLVRDELEQGLLEQVLPDQSAPLGIVHAVFPSRRGLVPAVRGLLDALVERYAACSEARSQAARVKPDARG